MGLNGGKSSKTVNRNSGRGKRIALGISIFVCAALAVLGGVAYKQISGMGGKGGARSVVESVISPRTRFPADKSRLNLLLIGIDYSYNNKGMRYTKESRADSILFASLDMDTRKISLLSVPRDTRVVKPDGSIGKINGLYSNFGRDSLIKAVADLTGVTPDHFVIVKPDSVKAIVDSLGGVEVETIDFLKYNDSWGHLFIDLPKGRQKINGEQAVGFARFREVDIYQRNPDGSPVREHGNLVLRRHIEHSKEEGDPRRMARQQQLIRAMASRATSFSNLFQLDTIVNTGLKQLDTDLSREQIFALAALFRTANPAEIASGTIPGKGEMRGRTFLFIPDKEKKQAAVDWLLKGDETAANRLTIVQVQNATQVPGAGRRVADLLKQQGFDVKNPTNVTPTPATTEPTPAPGAGGTRIVYTKASYAARARRIAELIGGGALIKETAPDKSGADGYEGESPDVTVILGPDLASRYAPQSAQN